ncbi:MAG: TIGR03085 family metal-binding protein [Ilumatobacteraceae bacterium]
MTSPAAVERSLLCDIMLELGPDAPTLSGDWTTRDLAAHLVVRERRPDAMPGILSGVLVDHSERVRLSEAERPYAEIVERVRAGAPIWSPTRVPAVDRLVNTIEFFVHHEDVRRAQDGWEARRLDADLRSTLESLLPKFGKMLTRKARVGLDLAPEGQATTTLHAGDPVVTLAGPIGECVLFLYGRDSVAGVALDGTDEAVAQLQATKFGI